MEVSASGRSLVSKSATNVVCLSVIVEVSASGRSLVSKSTTECGVSECFRGALTTRKSLPTCGCHTMGGGYRFNRLYQAVTLVFVNCVFTNCNAVLNRMFEF